MLERHRVVKVIILVLFFLGIYAEKIEGYSLKKKVLIADLAPLVIVPSSFGFLAIDDEAIFWSWCLIAVTFSLGTIPAHIYVKTPPLNISFLSFLKFMSGIGIAFAGGIAVMDCEFSEEGCDPSGIYITTSVIEIILLGGIYAIETVYTYNRASQLEKETSGSSFYIQPLLGKRGELFILGGIRF